MLNDLEIAKMCQALYDGHYDQFTEVNNTSGVDWAYKAFDDYTLIVFEGTHDLLDAERDFEANLLPAKGIGKVHWGFYDGLESVYMHICDALHGSVPIVIAGHSLGAGRAQIFTAILAREGFTKLQTVTFGCPLPGDAALARVLDPFPNRIYFNYKNEIFRDPVGIVPFYIPEIAPYVIPRERILICEPPPMGDPWGILMGYHHLSLYINGLAKLFPMD